MPGLDADTVVFRFGEFTLDTVRGTLTRRGTAIPLRPKSYAVLLHLVEHAGQLVGKNDLMGAVWGKTVVTDGSLTQCVIDIRRALDDHDQQYVRTIPRRGFVFEAPVTREHATPEAPVETPGEAGAARAKPPGPRGSPSWTRHPVTWALLALCVLASAWWAWSQRSPSMATKAPVPVLPAAAPNSIAVLRFDDLSPSQDQAYFADGLAEEILNLLASSRLRVTARTSSFAIQPEDADIRTIARQLNVAYLLQGSVRRDQDRVRVTVQLVDAATDTQVWSRSYERRFSSFLDLQQAIAADVANTLHVSLSPVQIQSDPDRAKAHDLYLLAQYLYHRRGPGDIEAALARYQQALELDPNHARAWVAVAGLYNAMSHDGRMDRDEAVARQGQALAKALSIDPQLAVAHARMSHYLMLTGDQEGAERSFQRAMELNPEDDIVLEIHSNLAMFEGRVDDAVAAIRTLVSRDPLSALRRNNLANFLLSAGHAQESVVQFRRAAELSPDQNFHWGIARALVIQGSRAEALAESKLIEREAWRDQVEALAAEGADASAAMDRLALEPDAMDSLYLAEIHAYRGEPDRAFEWLARTSRAITAAPLGGPESRLRMEVAASPFLRRVHDDPRWQETMDSLRSRPADQVPASARPSPRGS